LLLQAGVRLVSQPPAPGHRAAAGDALMWGVQHRPSSVERHFRFGFKSGHSITALAMSALKYPYSGANAFCFLAEVAAVRGR